MASRKNQDELVANPAKHFLNWSNIQTVKVIDGEEFKKITGGEFRYYDKEVINEATGKGTNIGIPFPFEFAILNSDCFSFKGNDKKKNNRYVWSNEVNEFTKNVEVKCKEDGSVASLMSFTKEDYKNKTKKEAIKEQLKGFGASYTQSVYISPKTEDGFTEIWNLQLDGGALSGGNGQNYNEVDPENKYDGWFGFTKQAKLQGKNLLSYTVKVDTYKPKKNGDVKFMIPVFEVAELVTKEENDQLMVLFEELEAYHKVDAKKNNKISETPVTADVEEGDGFTS